MGTPPSLQKYESVATVIELRGLAEVQKRLDVISENRLVKEYIELQPQCATLIADLDARLVDAESD